MPSRRRCRRGCRRRRWSDLRARHCRPRAGIAGVGRCSGGGGGACASCERRALSGMRGQGRGRGGFRSCPLGNQEPWRRRRRRRPDSRCYTSSSWRGGHGRGGKRARCAREAERGRRIQGSCSCPLGSLLRDESGSAHRWKGIRRPTGAQEPGRSLRAAFGETSSVGGAGQRAVWAGRVEGLGGIGGQAVRPRSPCIAGGGGGGGGSGRCRRREGSSGRRRARRTDERGSSATGRHALLQPGRASNRCRRDGARQQRRGVGGRRRAVALVGNAGLADAAPHSGRGGAEIGETRRSDMAAPAAAAPPLRDEAARRESPKRGGWGGGRRNGGTRRPGSGVSGGGGGSATRKHMRRGGMEGRRWGRNGG